MPDAGRVGREAGPGKITQSGVRMHGLRALAPSHLGTTTHRSNRLGGALQAGETDFLHQYPKLSFSEGFLQCFARETLETATWCRLQASARLQALLEQC